MDIDHLTNHGRSFGSSSSSSSSSSSLTCAEKMATAGFGGGLIMILLCGITGGLYAYIKKGRRKSNGKSHFEAPNPQPFHGRFNPGLGGQQAHPPPPPPPAYHPPPPAPQTSIFNKPLPPPPTLDKPVTASEITKILQRLTDKDNKDKNNNDCEDPTDYESIDERIHSFKQSMRKRRKSSDANNNGVYIVYLDKKNKNKNNIQQNQKYPRPKSCPPSLREKWSSKKSDKKVLPFPPSLSNLTFPPHSRR
jgi:hypothetical protein